MRYLILNALLALAACANHEDARRVLENAGYADIVTSGGYPWG